MIRLLILIWVGHQVLFLAIATGIIDFNLPLWKITDTILMIPIIWILAKRSRNVDLRLKALEGK